MTNRKDMIDDALLRPGRLEVHVEIGLPDVKGRLQILGIHTKSMQQAKRITPETLKRLPEIAENSKNFSYHRLFSAHLHGAREITIVDPYIRAFWQLRNFMELVQLIRELTPDGDESKVASSTSACAAG